jgi:hypothetical protein
MWCSNIQNIVTSGVVLKNKMLLILRAHGLQTISHYYKVELSMKVDCKNYKGIEYVQLNELPQTQQDKLISSLGEQEFIKILIDGRIVGRCIQYKHYSAWYETFYKPKTVLQRETRITETLEMEPNLALNKV